MFCHHDRHPLYDFVKDKEKAVCIEISDKEGGDYISTSWSHKKTPGDYVALALGLVFDNVYDAEQRLKELVEEGKRIEKEIIKGKKE